MTEFRESYESLIRDHQLREENLKKNIKEVDEQIERETQANEKILQELNEVKREKEIATK